MSLYEAFKADCGGCTLCKAAGLLHEKARPLFMGWEPQRTSVLFVLEAPNLSDTIDRLKGYITVDATTDDTGSFLNELVEDVLRWKTKPEVFVTNSVLCLPREKVTWDNGKRKVSYPVAPAQREMCSEKLHTLILLFKPRIVCPIGGEALSAMKGICPHHYTLKKNAGSAVPWNGIMMFPLYHTGYFGQITRNRVAQRSDWAALKTEIERTVQG